MEIKKMPTEKKWVRCPNCGAKVILYDDVANCSGVYPKCTRGCGVAFELIIQDGKQIMQ